MTRKVRLALAAVGATLLVCLLILEVGLRLAPALLGDASLLTSDAELGWRLKPGAARTMTGRGGPYHVQISQAGLRDRYYDYSKPADAYRVVVLGDSYVFGAGGVEQHEILTELIEARHPRLEVINLGVPGYSLDQELLLLKREGLRYEPDLVVVCAFWNDDNESFLTYHPKIARPKPALRRVGGELHIDPPSFSGWEKLFDASHLARFIERRVATLKAKQRSAPLRDIRDEERAFCFQAAIAAMRDACRAAGAELVFVYIPFPWGQQAAPVLLQLVLEDAARRGDVLYLDLLPTLYQQPAQSPPFFPGDGHLNSHGHQLVADRLEQFLVEATSFAQFKGTADAAAATDAP